MQLRQPEEQGRHLSCWSSQYVATLQDGVAGGLGLGLAGGMMHFPNI